MYGQEDFILTFLKRYKKSLIRSGKDLKIRRDQSAGKMNISVFKLSIIQQIFVLISHETCLFQHPWDFIMGILVDCMTK